jgi:hypothetical protein
VKKTALKEYILWQKITTTIEKQPNWRYSIQVQAKDLCLRTAAAQGCITSLSVASELSLPLGQPFKIHNLGPLALLGVDLDVHLSESSQQEQASDYVEILRKLLDIHYETITVNIDRLRVLPADSSSEIIVQGNLGFTGYQEGLPSTVTINLTQLGNHDWRQLSGEVEISGVSKENLFQALAVKSTLKIGHKDGSIHFTGELHPPDPEQNRSNEFHLSYNIGGNKIGLSSTGSLSKSAWDASMDVDLQTVNHQLVGIGLKPCRLTMNFINESPLNGFNTNLSCRGRGQRQQLSRENVIGLFVPQTILFALNGDISFVRTEQVNSVETHVSLSIDRVSSDLYNLDGQVLLDGTLDLNHSVNTNHEVRFAIGFEVPDFQKAVRKLAETDISVPAPFNQLAGGAVCDANGRFQTIADIEKFPLHCESRLSSKGQKANLKLASELSLRRFGNRYRPHIEGEILMDEVLFTLPDIDIRKPIPQMFRDKRFQSIEEQARENDHPKEAPITYSFRIRTSENKPLQFRTELLPNLIPLFVNLRFDEGKEMSGSVAIRDYQIELFKRTAKIENMEVTFLAGNDLQNLKGMIRFPNKDYALGMDIYGSLQEPSYHFSSTPPLEDSQILGLLLFGEEPTNLDDETQRSIGHTQNAMADKAVGLLSMYYLASTPIERLGYDPNAQVFTAQFRLPDGVLLTFGSDVDSKGTVGLRKKLTGNWSIDTTAERNSETDAQKGRASLNWSKRF